MQAFLAYQKATDTSEIKEKMKEYVVGEPIVKAGKAVELLWETPFRKSVHHKRSS
jgi:hypothetical protein